MSVLSFEFLHMLQCMCAQGYRSEALHLRIQFGERRNAYQDAARLPRTMLGCLMQQLLLSLDDMYSPKKHFN